MSRKRQVKITLAALLAVLFAAGLWFARPMTLERISGIEIGACTKMQIHYGLESGKVLPEETVELSRENEEFFALLEALQGKKFSRSPFWWIPRGGKSHRWTDGDFWWDMDLIFEDAELPDGTTGSGAIIQLYNFFGDLDLRGYDGRRYPIRTADQEQWAKDVLDAALTKTDPK